MGAWSAEPFGNDTALDWLVDLAEGATTLSATLDGAVASGAGSAPLGVLEADACLAAVALVAMGEDPSLRERWGPDVTGVERKLQDLLPQPGALRDRAARCLPLIARSESAELWAGDDEWWGVLRSLAAALETEAPVPGAAPDPERRAPKYELVAPLQLPAVHGSHYVALDSGDVVRVPNGSSIWERETLAQVVVTGAFEREEGFSYWIDEAGDLVRLEYDAKVAEHLSARFDVAPSSSAEVAISNDSRAARARLDELIEEVLSGCDLEELVARSRTEELDPSRRSSISICTLATWREWRALGPVAHRRALAECLRDCRDSLP